MFSTEIQLEDKIKSIVHSGQLPVNYNRSVRFRREKFRLHFPRSKSRADDLVFALFYPKPYDGRRLRYLPKAERIKFELSFFFQEYIKDLATESGAVINVAELFGRNRLENSIQPERWRGSAELIETLGRLDNIIVLPEFYRLEDNQLSSIFARRYQTLLIYTQSEPGPGDYGFGESLLAPVLQVLTAGQEHREPLHYFLRPLPEKETAQKIEAGLENWRSIPG